jgi:ABC-2 type transport system ATP-binding protein
VSEVVRVENISKIYATARAVDGVSFTVREGTIYGLLGPNGAGKTTAIRMMMRIIYPDSGSIEVLGHSLRDVPKDRIGYLPEERGVYPKMKVLDLLTFFGQIKSMEKAAARKAALDWLERLGLSETAGKKVEELSKGMQQKVQFIATVMPSPPLIILDEPFSGLDPVNTDVLKNIILDFHRKGHTIIFSTHMMDQVEKLCQEICLINRGRKVLEGALREVKRSFGHNTVTIRFEGDGTFLGKMPEVEGINDHGQEVFLRLKDGTDPGTVLKRAAERLRIQKFEISEPSIHDIFVEQVSRG